jgi:hypothetical protein
MFHQPKEDNMTEEEIAEIRGIEQVDVSLADIAIVKGHEYANARAPNNVRLYGDMKDAYKEGFLQGFAHKMGGGHEGN